MVLSVLFLAGLTKATLGFGEALLAMPLLTLGMAQWLTPWQTDQGSPRAMGRDGALVTEVAVDKGRLILVGSYLGESYFETWTPGFEALLNYIARSSGWQPEIEVLSQQPSREAFVYIKYGAAGGSGEQHLAFVFFPAGCDQAALRFRPGFFAGDKVEELLSGRPIELSASPQGQEVTLSPARWRIAVLAG